LSVHMRVSLSRSRSRDTCPSTCHRPGTENPSGKTLPCQRASIAR
jgi:hypothetical protein